MSLDGRGPVLRCGQSGVGPKLYSFIPLRFHRLDKRLNSHAALLNIYWAVQTVNRRVTQPTTDPQVNHSDDHHNSLLNLGVGLKFWPGMIGVSSIESGSSAAEAPGNRHALAQRALDNSRTKQHGSKLK